MRKTENKNQTSEWRCSSKSGIPTKQIRRERVSRARMRCQYKTTCRTNFSNLVQTDSMIELSYMPWDFVNVMTGRDKVLRQALEYPLQTIIYTKFPAIISSFADKEVVKRFNKQTREHRRDRKCAILREVTRQGVFWNVITTGIL